MNPCPQAQNRANDAAEFTPVDGMAISLTKQIVWRRKPQAARRPFLVAASV
jgi:hypothetical protein